MAVATPKQIEELRGLIYAKLEAGLPNLRGEPHPADVDRIREDAWLKRFLEHQECDVNLALQMLIETIVWRKTNNTNEIGESRLNMDYLQEGLFYPRGKDIDDCTMFVFKSKKHVKGQRDSEELKKCIVYWLERLDRVDKCKRISVFFDMADTGMSNMDMDFTRYLISMFKFYYPDFLNYIFIYELPWVLNAAFKVIKTLLPAKAVAKMKFINKSTVKDFIPLEQAQRCWGGSDDYVYSFVSEPSIGNYIPTVDSASKKVTFSDPGSPITENAPQINNNNNFKVSLFRVQPEDSVVFAVEGKEMSGHFVLTNSHNGPISYKIKTTSPEKFRVRPSMGVLLPNASQNISLLLLEGYKQPAAAKEKFLVMCIPVIKENLTPQEVSDLWRNTSNPEMEQHKLRCSYPGKKIVKNEPNLNSSLSTASEHPVEDIAQRTQVIAGLKHNEESLESQLKGLKTLQLLNILLTSVLTCLIIYFFKYVGKEGESEFCTRP